MFELFGLPLAHFHLNRHSLQPAGDKVEHATASKINRMSSKRMLFAQLTVALFCIFDLSPAFQPHHLVKPLTFLFLQLPPFLQQQYQQPPTVFALSSKTTKLGIQILLPHFFVPRMPPWTTWTPTVAQLEDYPIMQRILLMIDL